jgi:high frequency lysogenization protein
MFDWLIPPPSREQTLALAGIFQACKLVDSYARTGTASTEGVEIALYSLLQQNPESTLAVYKDIANLEQGLATMEKILANPKDNGNALALRYVIGVLHIARKIAANPKMLERIGSGIDKAARQAEHFSPTHANVIANIADLYQNTISTLKFRIQVNGVATNLQQPAIASRIRCLLFSAVRSAFLWRQLRGNRLQLLVQRGKLLAQVQQLRSEIARR